MNFPRLSSLRAVQCLSLLGLLVTNQAIAQRPGYFPGPRGGCGYRGGFYGRPGWYQPYGEGYVVDLPPAERFAQNQSRYDPARSDPADPGTPRARQSYLRAMKSYLETRGYSVK
jgi:hypothetical protein